MRRVAGTLYNKNKRYAQALELAKKDKLYKDAMFTAATSQVSLLLFRFSRALFLSLSLSLPLSLSLSLSLVLSLLLSLSLSPCLWLSRGVSVNV